MTAEDILRAMPRGRPRGQLPSFPRVNCPSPACPRRPDAGSLLPMSDFHDEARSRVSRLLRMARHDDPAARERLVRHAEVTPEPPPMGSHGLATRGCPSCRGTMWAQKDRTDLVWVCAGCGNVEGVTARCPHCQTPMRPGNYGRDFCKTCPRVAAPGDTEVEIEARELQRLDAIRLLDASIAERAADR